MEPKTLHILLVDDDTNLLATMGDILKAKGFEPVTAKTGAAALARNRAGDIDVALIDLNLEDMPGLELLSRLKTESPGIECILLTGHASQGSAIQAINAGAYSYFQKPCDIDQLVLSIQRAGEKRAAGQALHESEERFRIIFEKANDGIAICNANDEFLDVNPRFCEMIGYSRAELLKMRIPDVQAPEVRRPANVAKNDLATHGNSLFEGLNLHRSGRRIPVEISVGQVELPAGEL